MPRLILLEMGCHLIDTARYLMGEVQSVAATIGRFGRGTLGEDVAMLTSRFQRRPGPARLELVRGPRPVAPGMGAERDGRRRDRRRPCGSYDGTLEWIGLDGTTRRRPVTLPPADQVYVDGYGATQRHFIDGFLSARAHETADTDNLKTMDVVWTAYRAAEEGAHLAARFRARRVVERGRWLSGRLPPGRPVR